MYMNQGTFPINRELFVCISVERKDKQIACQHYLVLTSARVDLAIKDGYLALMVELLTSTDVLLLKC